MDDHELLSAYVAGDEQAFATLVEKYFRMVYTVAVRQTGDSHLAEDIAQSVFLLLSRKARGFSTKAPVPGWLLRTTRFVCLDAIKMRRRRDQNERNLAMNLQPHLESSLEPNRIEVLLEEALQALRPEELAGIVARFFEGKDFEEIAEMFSITEEAARKRTSRCLAKLQSFMSRRGAKASFQEISNLLMVQPAQEIAQQVLQSTIHVVHAGMRGELADGNVLSLANHAERLLRLRQRFLTRLTVTGAFASLLVCFGLAILGWYRSGLGRIERLGQEWGALDSQVAQHRQFLMQTDPNSPNYQARVQSELDLISRQSSRLIRELNVSLVPREERDQLAEFLTAGLSSTMKLDPSKRRTLFLYIQNRLGRGKTVNEALKQLAEGSRTEAADIKQMLTPAQQKLFDNVYGADGVLLFSYAKAGALGRIGA